MKENKNIHGFKIPEGYFDTFEDELFATIAEEDLPKHTGFTTPDSYFEVVEDQIMATIKASDTPEVSIEKRPKVISLFRKQTLGYVAAVAASIVLVFSLVNQEKSVSEQLDNLQFATVDTYIDAGNLSIDQYDMASYLSDTDIENLSYEDELFSEENLKEYLLDYVNEETLSIQ